MRPIHLRLRRWTLALLCLTTACGSSSLETPRWTINGQVVVVEGAGEVILTAQVDGQRQSIITATVDELGAFNTTLPAQVPLPAQTNLAQLPLQPEAAYLGIEALSCEPNAALQNSEARLLVVDGGEYKVNGQIVGSVKPGTVALSGASLQTTTNTLVYADRALKLSVKQNCQYQQGGQSFPALLTVELELYQGWNVISRQSNKPLTAGLGMLAMKTTALAKPTDLNWRYFPK